MNNFMPLGPNIVDQFGLDVGRTLQNEMLPFLTRMGDLNNIMRRRGDTLSQIGSDITTLVIDMMGFITGLQAGVQSVQVVNLGFLELMAASSNIFLILIFLKLHDINRRIGGTNVRLNQLGVQLTAISTQLNNIAAQLSTLIGCVCGLLSSILDVLLQFTANVTIQVGGTITYLIDLGPGFKGIDLSDLISQLRSLAWWATVLNVLLPPLTATVTALSAALSLLAGALALVAGALNRFPSNLKDIVDQLLKLGGGLIVLSIVLAAIGLSGEGLVGLVVGLIMLGAFLFAIAYALKQMPGNMKAIVDQLFILIITLAGLAGALALLKPDQIKNIALGLGSMALFMIGLGIALRIMPEKITETVSALKTLFEALNELANAIKDFTPAQLEQIGAGFLGIVLFIGLLGLALRLIPDQIGETTTALQTLFQALTNLANAILSFTPAQMLQIAAGLAGIVVFVALLGLALSFFPDQAASATTAIAQLSETMINLANAILSFTPGQMLQIAAGLAGIVVFVALLGVTLWAFQDAFVQAGTALALLIAQLNNLTTTLANLSIGQLIMLGIGLALLIGFIIALGVVATITAPELTMLAGALQGIASGLQRIVDLASEAASGLKSVASAALSFGGGLLSPITSLIPFQEGGVMPYDGPAYLHAGERVLTADENRAMMQGLTPANGGGGAVDNSINVGGVTITINAQRVDADSAGLLSDEIVARLQERLGVLQTEKNFRSGVRASEA